MKKILLILSIALLGGCASNPEIDKNKNQLDPYMEAAKYFAMRQEDNGFAALKSLSDEGFAPAAEFSEYIEKGLIGAAQTKGTIFQTRLKASWEGIKWIPPHSAGNSAMFIALQGLPRSLDSSVVEWITNNQLEGPPVLLFEAVRRLADIDFDEAVRLYALGMLKIRYEILRCDEKSLSDLPALWKPYPSFWLLNSSKVDSTQDMKVKFKSSYKSALIKISESYSDVVPIDMSLWQSCRGTHQAMATGKPTTKLWETAHQKLEDQIHNLIKKL